MGSSNLATRRGAKAVRRKAIVTQKHKAELAEATPAAQAARASTLPVRACVVSEEIFETGMGTLVLARGSSVGSVSVAAFLLDTFCLGVKDVSLRTIEADELEIYLNVVEMATPLVEVEPSYARKLLRDLVRWSEALGFPPARGYSAAERLFGDVDPAGCTDEFEFGMNGKPFYVPGPTEPAAQTARRIEQLSQHLGPDGFEYMIEIPSPEGISAD